MRSSSSRSEDGERFVIPITAVIETGNHIAQAPAIDARRPNGSLHCRPPPARAEAPFTVHRASLDDQFLAELCAGNATGQPFIDLADAGMGAGDIAILVERDRFKRDSAYTDVHVWTLDMALGAHG